MKQQKNDCSQQGKCCEQNQQGKNKKPYARPELSKHGKVESLTQTPLVGPSGPIQPS